MGFKNKPKYASEDFWGGWGERQPLRSPVEADLVQALLAGLVDGVEPGAGVLLLPAVCNESQSCLRVVLLQKCKQVWIGEKNP